MEAKKFKVIIVEDVKLELKGTEEIFRHEIPDAEVIGTAMTEQEFWGLMETGVPDLVLLDLGLGGSTTIGVEICRNIFKRYPGVHVLIFTGEILNEKLWVDVLDAGADGIILKTGELLTKTDVQAVMDGKKLVFNYPILEKIVERFKTSVRNDAKRQEAVISYDIDEYDERFLRHLALGYTKEMIANLKGMPHPATMFFLLTLGVIFLSWIFDVYGLSVRLPQTGEEIRVQSLLSPEGIRWLLRHVVTNFTGFAPLGLVIVAMFGIGVAQHSGFIDACIRKGIRGRGRNPWHIVLSVIVLGLLSNVVGDAGYIILLPIAATLFHSVGLHPVGGIIAAYVSVSCGYSANILLSTLDPMLAAATQEAADMTDVSGGRVGPLCNYYFFCASTFLLVLIIYHITRRRLLPGLGEYNGSNAFCGYKQLSRKEQRALLGAVIVGLLYAALVLWATFSSWGILRGVNGGR